MLPNSRIIPPSTSNNNKNLRRRSNSASAATMMYESNQQKKGFISRLLTNPNTPKDYHQQQRQTMKLKYDALGTPLESLTSVNNNARQIDSGIKSSNSIKSSSSTGSKGGSNSSSGFGKLFKKRGKTLDDTDIHDQLEDDLPKVRPIHNNSISRKHTKIPLAPPPIIANNRQDHLQLSTLPDQYLAKRPVMIPEPIPQPPLQLQELKIPISNTQKQNSVSSRSSSSLRKSSGSYSIYSTFGGDDSIYSVESTKREVEGSVDSFSTVKTTATNNNQNENMDTADDAENESIDDEDEEEEEEDDDDDAFVDATGASQEDIEREKRNEINKNLTKRLSGGHFGSAGGLVLSINPENDSTTTPPPIPSIQQQHKRKSKNVPTDEELAKSMLNWKRHSDSNKRWSAIMRQHSPPPENEIMTEDKHASTVTVIDMRSTTAPLSEGVKSPKNLEEDEEELSMPDKMARRKEAEKALSGSTSPELAAVDQSNKSTDRMVKSSTTTTLASLSSSSTLTDNSETTISTAEMFSKTLDDVWKTSDATLDLFNDPKSMELHSSIQNNENSSEKLDEKIRDTALSLWKEDESVVSKERMAEWLGQGKPFNSAVLYHYMEYFYFADMRLDSAFRKLCSKLYFKAEAQQIDRILESFANRYWDCNQECLFGSADVVYAVVYSLLLLNTDLHVAQGNHARMTRSEFIRNTMSTIRDQRNHEEAMGYKKRSAINTRNWEAEVENYMKEMYTSVKQYQILQPLSRKTSMSRRNSIMGSKRVIGIKRSVNSIIRKSGRESALFPEDQQQSGATLTVPTSPPPPRSSVSSGNNRPMTPSIKSNRRESFSSVTSSSATSFSSRCTSPTSPQSQPMIQYMNAHSSSLFSSRPPYFKEGVVMRKHLLETASQKAKHREWRECYLEVDQEGELKMYALQHPQTYGDKSMFRHSSVINFNQAAEKSPKPSSSSYGGPNNNHNSNSKWAASSQLIGKISLNHTLSNPLPPPGYNRQRPHVFAIQQSDGGVYLFQAASAEQTQEWVATCNYWAARESKEPLPGGVGNMEYGWGACLDDVILDLDAMRKGYDQKQYINSSSCDPDSIHIHDWLPPGATMVSSQLDEKEQFDMLQKHLTELNGEINQHRDIKAKILIKFPTKCNNHQKVLVNWEARSKYLLHDIIKYQNYCDALEKSIKQKEQELAALIPEMESPLLSSLTYQSNDLDLFKEINQELSLHI